MRCGTLGADLHLFLYPRDLTLLSGSVVLQVSGLFAPRYFRSCEQSGLVTLTFDLESGVRVTCDSANFGLPRPLCSRLRPNVRGRQTDVIQYHRLMLPPIKGGGITMKQMIRDLSFCNGLHTIQTGKNRYEHRQPLTRFVNL